ncbi:alpha/beta hydrolase [Falsiroseomonas tokyonensis]|uniref:Alpha/beta hydrolase n=1 Tax=Falsiroseomonas tokyonensis TaxID=430521 RepID=A0ABV7C152_9PROT|nr:alpha/beta hydrolase-fold protein [Falsiroseomonas tokyonensis]MBU8540380.1 alpha/beta hydrolase [Falsiroseomonas tokyonensis]
MMHSTPAAVVLPRSQCFDLPGGQRVMVAVPAGPAPEAGFPVLYHLDGNAVFASMVEALRIQSPRGAATGVAPGIIVGIGYPVDGPFDRARRTLDYTPAVDPARLGERPDGGAWTATGGADAFLEVLEREVKPLVEGLAPVDPARQALFGHSLGGLFALHVLLTRPESFARIVAISPSLWFGEGMLLERRPPPGPRPAVMIGVGGEEEPAETPGEDAHAAKRRAHGLITRARRFAEALPAERFQIFAGENHGSVVHAALGASLRFALPTR